MSDTFALLADAYLDDALDEAQTERLLTYLRDSPAAREHLQALAGIDHGLRGLAGTTNAGKVARLAVLARIRSAGGSKRFRQAVEGQLRQRRPRWTRRLRQRPRWPTLAAAAIITVTAVLGAIGYSAFTARSAISDPTVAVIESITGWVSRQHGEVDETVRVGQALGVGDVLTTGDQASAILRLSDGTRLTLSAAGSVRLPGSDGARVGLERGSVLAEVTPQPPAAPPLLSTDDATIRVLGTTFTLSADGSTTAVSVSHGVVAVRTKAGRDWEVQSGESLRIAGAHLERTRPLAVRRRPTDAWHDGNARTLSDVPALNARTPVTTDEWGGRTDRTLPTTGRFAVQQQGGRWWLIDPAGHPLIATGISNVRHGLGPESAVMLARFGSYAGWSTWADELLTRHAFTTRGTKSDHLVPMTGAVTTHDQPRTAVLSLEIAEEFSRLVCTKSKALSNDGEAEIHLRQLAPLLPGFRDWLRDWEVTARTQVTSAVMGVVTDSMDDTFTWPVLRRLAQNNDEIRATLSSWLAKRQRTLATADADDLGALRRESLQAYHDLVYPAARRVAPDALLLGQSLAIHWLNDNDIVAHLCRDIDAVAVGLIGQWQEDPATLQRLSERVGRPLWINNFYARGVDSGLSSRDGNGLEVATQADRGRFYQHLTLLLLESRVVIGWQWYRFEDLGLTTPNSPANYNVNKGVVSPAFVPYEPLLKAMGEVNRARYAICDYFDRSAP